MLALLVEGAFGQGAASAHSASRRTGPAPPALRDRLEHHAESSRSDHSTGAAWEAT